MKEKSEFEQILELAMGRKPDNAADPFKESSKDLPENFITRLMFGEERFRVKIFATSTNPNQKYPKEEKLKYEKQKFEHLKEETLRNEKIKLEKSERENLRSENTKSRDDSLEKSSENVKQTKKLNFDQRQAMKIFIKFDPKYIDESATLEEVKVSFRRLARKYHPDAGSQSDSIFKLISVAYKKLTK